MRLLSKISSVSKLLPALCLGALRQFVERSAPFCRHADTCGGVAASNGKTTGVMDESTFKLDHQHGRVFDQQEDERRRKIPTGDDARATSCLQSYLHRLWPYSRIQIHNQRDAERGRM